MIFVFLFLVYFTLYESLGPSTSLQMAQFHSFLWQSNIPLYICTTSSLFIPLLMDIQIASMSWLLYILLQWMLGCIYLSKLWPSPGIWPGGGLLDHMVVLYSVFKGSFILFFIVAVSIYIPTKDVRGIPFLQTLSRVYCL